MIFVNITGNLYRVVRVSRSLMFGEPAFMLISRWGTSCEHQIHHPSKWRFYTGQVAELLTLAVGHSYPNLYMSANQSDNQIAKSIPAKLVGDKSDSCSHQR